MTTGQLLEHISASKRGMERAIQKMKEAGQIHVKKWERREGWGGRHARVWAIGPGNDAKIRKKPRLKVYSDYNIKRRANHALKAHAGSPFASMIAQMRMAEAMNERRD